jgi:endonuclease YncB( thermonuclease family)
MRQAWIFLLAWLPASATAAGPMATLQGRATVTDGDTVNIGGVGIRLFGIDTPEIRQTCLKAGVVTPCGQQAAQALRAAIGQATVSCQQQDTDIHLRPVATCSANGIDLNAYMVSRGWAVAYREFSCTYVGLEGQARAQGLGIWSMSFTNPKYERRGRGPTASDQKRDDELVEKCAAAPVFVTPVPPASSVPTSCIIKGNVSAKGEKIYHLPGGAFYDQTTISGPDERMFCSEAEAQAAGWRKAGR